MYHALLAALLKGGALTCRRPSRQALKPVANSGKIDIKKVSEWIVLLWFALV